MAPRTKGATRATVTSKPHPRATATTIRRIGRSRSPRAEVLHWTAAPFGVDLASNCIFARPRVSADNTVGLFSPWRSEHGIGRAVSRWHQVRLASDRIDFRTVFFICFSIRCFVWRRAFVSAKVRGSMCRVCEASVSSGPDDRGGAVFPVVAGHVAPSVTTPAGSAGFSPMG